MVGPYNIVKKLSFDIQINSASADRMFAAEVADFCQSHFLPGIERQLLPYADGKRIRIERLELDLGECSARDWNSVLTDKLESMLREKLAAIALSKRHKEPGKSPPEQDAIRHALYFFLEYGSLPWWYSTTAMGRLEKVFSPGLKPGSARALIQWIHDHPPSLPRFIATFSETVLADCARSAGIPEGVAGAKQALFKNLILPLFPAAKEPVFRVLFWKTVIQWYAAGGFRKDNFELTFLKSLLTETVRHYAGAPDFFATSQGQALASILEMPSLEVALNSSQFRRFILETIKRGTIPAKGTAEKRFLQKDAKKEHPPNAPQQQKTRSEKGSKTNGTPVEKEPESPKVAIPDTPFTSRESVMEEEGPPTESAAVKISAPGEKEGAYVQHAGIVLLHPFLSQFFENVGLMVNEQWKDEAAAKKAVHFLAYLATGRAHCPEYEQLLFKHLCGLPWPIFIEPALSLSHSEMKEADTLLQAVVEHWAILKNTAPEDLQQGFFQREGKLWKSERGWQLQVEQQSQDVLLQQLPWGLSVVQLPWLKEMIWINWT